MIKLSQLSKEIYHPKDIARFVDVTTRTLENWESKGKINFRRNPETNRRFLTKSDVINLLKKQNLLVDDYKCSSRRRLHTCFTHVLNYKTLKKAHNLPIRFSKTSGNSSK